MPSNKFIAEVKIPTWGDANNLSNGIVCENEDGDDLKTRSKNISDFFITIGGGFPLREIKNSAKERMRTRRAC
jgi:hypothetical protein